MRNVIMFVVAQIVVVYMALGFITHIIQSDINKLTERIEVLEERQTLITDIIKFKF